MFLNLHFWSPPPFPPPCSVGRQMTVTSQIKRRSERTCLLLTQDAALEGHVPNQINKNGRVPEGNRKGCARRVAVAGGNSCGVVDAMLTDLMKSDLHLAIHKNARWFDGLNPDHVPALAKHTVQHAGVECVAEIRTTEEHGPVKCLHRMADHDLPAPGLALLLHCRVQVNEDLAKGGRCNTLSAHATHADTRTHARTHTHTHAHAHAHAHAHIP